MERKINIQFMTVAENGIATKDKDWRGNTRYKFKPDYNKLVENASCQEEAEAIREIEKLDMKFSFEIVFMVYVDNLKQDLKTMKLYKKKEWQIYQFPWYQTEDGTYYSKERMINMIMEQVPMSHDFISF